MLTLRELLKLLRMGIINNPNLCRNNNYSPRLKGVYIMKNGVKILALVGLLSLASSFPALAAWEQQPDTTWKYFDESAGAYLTGQWIESQTEKGLWYYLDDAGVMVTDKVIDGYYVNELGEWREGSGGASQKPSSGGSSQSTQAPPSQGQSSQQGVESLIIPDNDLSRKWKEAPPL